MTTLPSGDEFVWEEDPPPPPPDHSASQGYFADLAAMRVREGQRRKRRVGGEFVAVGAAKEPPEAA